MCGVAKKHPTRVLHIRILPRSTPANHLPHARWLKAALRRHLHPAKTILLTLLACSSLVCGSESVSQPPEMVTRKFFTFLLSGITSQSLVKDSEAQQRWLTSTLRKAIRDRTMIPGSSGRLIGARNRKPTPSASVVFSVRDRQTATTTATDGSLIQSTLSYLSPKGW